MNNQNKAIQATIGGKVDNENTNLLDKFFEIPAYQRLYEWESTQIEELLNDIKKRIMGAKGNTSSVILLRTKRVISSC